MGIEHTASADTPAVQPQISTSALLIAIKASGILTLVGLLAGIGFTVAWNSTGGGDSVAFAALATVMFLILGGLFGTLGTALAYLVRQKVTANPWGLAAAFALPALVTLCAITVFSFNAITAAVILGVTVILFLFGRWYVAPKLVAAP